MEAIVNSSDQPTDTSSKTSERVEDPTPTTSMQEHLMHKAQQCLKDREKYIAKLGEAQGNDVVKYMLLLNCIDCQGFVTEIQLQAHNSFDWSTRIAVAGFCLLTVSVIAAVSSQMLDMKSLEIAYVSGVSGLITTFISSIFFYLYNRSLKRMDAFHVQLREIQRIVASLFLSGLIQQSDAGDQERKEIIGRLLSDLGSAQEQQARTGNKHTTNGVPNDVLQPAA
jgi:hypothetical protein